MNLFNIPNELWQFEILTYMSYTNILKLIDSIENSEQRINFIEYVYKPFISTHINTMRDILISYDVFSKIRIFEDEIILDIIRHMTNDMTTQLNHTLDIEHINPPNDNVILCSLKFYNSILNKGISFYKIKDHTLDMLYSGLWFGIVQNDNYNHNIDKPYMIGWYENGNKKLEHYKTEKTNYHRKNGPAIIEWYDNGTKKLEKYKINNKYLNANNPYGPTFIEWYENGNKKSEHYQFDELYHRVNGPALIEWYENGNKKSEHYKVFNNYFNSNGSVKIEWN